MRTDITYADVTKDASGNLVSNMFNDIYFDKRDGYQESLYVFFKQNDLPQRWRDKQNFTIFETGFGTGLNFLIAQNLWQEKKGGRLRFASVEKYPLSEKDIVYAWQFFPPEITQEKDRFLPWYSNLTKGLNILHLKGVELFLFIGNVEVFLPQIAKEIGMVDSWFLDGFAPAKNPQMWQENLWQTMAKTTPPNGTFATFSAAGFVKRGLSDAGFQVEKVKGFGKKREMLKGVTPFE
jgi:tRNA 5-methylaminomethyl-2-thiouridine biosynthesis bifunctional protein